MSSHPLSNVPIDKIEVAAYTIPTDSPESDGTLEWSKTTIVVVQVEAGREHGLGYTYADTSTAKLIHDLLSAVVKGRNVMDIAGVWDSMVHAIRNLGRPGIASMAISAVDIALCDLKAQVLDVPLVSLWGTARESIAIYGSGGFTSYSKEELKQQLAAWVDSGISMVKMKVGRDAAADVRRVQAAREAIGDTPELFVDANGAYSRNQASAQALRFHEFGVTWFEEPVSSDDLEGLRFIRDRAPEGMDIAAGEYGYDATYFHRMLEAGAVDVLQADATRCGGFTGFFQAAALCLARSMEISAHTAPAVHMHVCCALPTVRHLEYFHDHVRIEKMLFDGVCVPEGGNLRPDLSRAGLGLALRRSDAKQFQVA